MNDTEQQGAPAEPASIDATMSAAYDKIMAAESAQAELEQPSQQRDASGKFVAAQAETPAEDTGTQEPDQTPAETPETTETVQPDAVKPVEPPHSWRKEAQEAFAKLPADVQQILAQHEAERDKGINAKLQEASAARQTVEAFDKIVQPYLPLIRAEGGTPLGAVQDLLNTAYQIRQNPAQTIARLAHQYGVDLSELANTAIQQPKVSPELAETRQRLQQLESFIQRGAQQQQQQTLQQANSEIEQFKASGKAPYLDELRKDMGDLIELGKATTLQEAYDKALRLNDNLYQKVVAEKQATEAKAKAEAARKASVVNVKSNGTSTAVGKKGASMEDTMSAVYDRMMAS